MVHFNRFQLSRRASAERGVMTMEWGLVALLVAIVCVALVGVIGERTSGMLANPDIITAME